VELSPQQAAVELSPQSRDADKADQIGGDDRDQDRVIFIFGGVPLDGLKSRAHRVVS
jgi:hypothetical protein